MWWAEKPLEIPQVDPEGMRVSWKVPHGKPRGKAPSSHP